MSLVAVRLAPAAPVALPEPVPAPAANAPDQALVAVITAAIHRYRRTRRERSL
jgi:Na+-transporting methylmalonyl-CoA/oxaloacetate decarboxylase gamma subunit